MAFGVRCSQCIFDFPYFQLVLDLSGRGPITRRGASVAVLSPLILSLPCISPPSRCSQLPLFVAAVIYSQGCRRRAGFCCGDKSVLKSWRLGHNRCQFLSQDVRYIRVGFTLYIRDPGFRAPYLKAS